MAHPTLREADDGCTVRKSRKVPREHDLVTVQDQVSLYPFRTRKLLTAARVAQFSLYPRAAVPTY